LTASVLRVGSVVVRATQALIGNSLLRTLIS
jgi:hypothetical protein